jgi:hypothetical protein
MNVVKRLSCSAQVKIKLGLAWVTGKVWRSFFRWLEFNPSPYPSPTLRHHEAIWRLIDVPAKQNQMGVATL